MESDEDIEAADSLVSLIEVTPEPPSDMMDAGQVDSTRKDSSDEEANPFGKRRRRLLTPEEEDEDFDRIALDIPPPENEVVLSKTVNASPEADIVLPYGVEPPQSRAAHEQVTSKPAKKRRKRYTEREKELVIRADAAEGRQGRLRVAALIGMPAATADSVIQKSRDGLNPEHDKRLDGHGGRQTLRKPYHERFILESLHQNSAMTLQQLRKGLNNETLRHLLIENNIPLTEAEKKFMGPFDAEKYLSEAPEGVLKAFERLKIRSPQTIENWLHGMIITKKHLVTERTTANSPPVMKKRLTFAQALLKTLPSERYFYVFIDEMPFYLTMHRSFGWAPKGQRAVVKIPPGGTLSYRTQVAMAVHPSIGLLHGECFPPEKLVSQPRSRGESVPEISEEEHDEDEAEDEEESMEQETQTSQTLMKQKKQKKVKKTKKSRKPPSAFKPVWGKKKFLEFLEQVLQRLILRGAEVSSCKVVIVLDGAPEHGPEAELPKLLSQCPSYKQLWELQQVGGGKTSILRMPANSPQLNLCEYYNRTLRTLANSLRNEKDIEADLLTNAARGQVIQRRLNVLEGIIEQAMDKMRLRHAEYKCTRRLMEFLKKVSDEGGYLDYHESM